MTQSVLIIGAGPVGLTLAIELARYAIPVRIAEKLAQRTDKSKALVLWSRTLELLDRQPGGSAPFIEAGCKAHAVNFFAGGETDRARRHGFDRQSLSVCADDPPIGHRAAVGGTP